MPESVYTNVCMYVRAYEGMYACVWRHVRVFL